MDAAALFYTITDILEPFYETLPLNPPATESDIMALERDLGVVLPESYKEILRLHDGENLSPPGGEDLLGLFGYYEFLSVAEVRTQYEIWRETANYWAEQDDDTVFTSAPEDFVQEVFVASGWLPFAGKYSGNHLALDFAPASRGVVGQVITFGSDEEVHHHIAPNFTEFLAFILAAYQEGKYHPKLTGNPKALIEDLPAFRV